MITKENEEVISYDVVKHLITEYIQIGELKIPKITTKYTLKDKIGTTKVRIGFNRYEYKVPAGVYAVGNPDESSPMFVTANYKLTFDAVRRELGGVDCYILVLDTAGINVWCAAGKGTFSSRELIYQMHKWDVKKTLGIRKVILPQLGAPSMEPHLVRKHSGVSVTYGPVRATDIKKYLENDYKADEAMRTVTFNLRERLALTPLEFFINFNNPMKFVLGIIALEMISFGILGSFNINRVIATFILATATNFMGSVGFPAVLPIMPFKKFSDNAIFMLIPIIALGVALGLLDSATFFIGGLTISWAFLSFICFNFTGSSTFTSQSGVEIEAIGFMAKIKLAAGLGMLIIMIRYMIGFI